ncbi:subfamily M23B unassigned peptidase [Shewanella sp. NFH-SH190041]|nr:peptidoglycan DD-metalloendopeptidase family protein [Shewanella sp. NFH-SH190041]BDM64993.1 subfamily M23B unassigned peptidase [Shewanella sp. NFH-SH190041]
MVNNRLQKSKDSWLIVSRTRLQRLQTSHKRILLATGLVVGAAVLWPSSQPTVPERITVPLKLDHLITDTPAIVAAVADKPNFDFVVKKGDTLSELFQRAGVDQQTMYQVLEADLNVLALDTLQPGNQVLFYLDDQEQLTKLELYFNAGHQVVFSRYDDGGFKYDDIKRQGIWQDRTITGVIHGSFYLSAKRQGLSAADIQRIENLYKDKINFGRDFRAGDKFSVLLSEQYVDGDATGDSNILGVSLETAGHELNTFQDSSGQFYDEHGHSLQRAFQRLPLAHMYRVSSSFNPHRRHPITGRIAPHNGTDFAVPVGTKVLAPGDGVVVLVTNHRYAGKYIVIDHGGKYRTRYLHLSKALVKRGDRVSRGQVIALSGNTGRTTGPHLHYEFMINGRPVNALTAKIPMAHSLTKRQRHHFAALVRKRKMQMGIS